MGVRWLEVASEGRVSAGNVEGGQRRLGSRGVLRVEVSRLTVMRVRCRGEVVADVVEGW